MTTQSHDLSPVHAQQRINLLDYLRGFALIGILFMNVEWFNRPDVDLLQFDFTQTGGNWAASWLVKVFIEGKFYKLFSLLFGMGFAVMLIRAQEVGRPFGAWFTRRMIVLFVIGMCHLVFLWGGDILHDYAVAGLMLLGFVFILRWKKLSRFNTPTAFAKTGFTLILLPFIILTFVGIGYGVTHDNQKTSASWQEKSEVIAQVEQRILTAQSVGEFLLTSAEYKALNENSNKQDETKKSEALTKIPEQEQTSDHTENSDLDQHTEESTPEERIEKSVNKQYESKQKRHYRSVEEERIFTEGDYWQATQHRWEKAIRALGNTPFFALFICLPLFMVGYWLIASERLKHPEKHQSFFNTLCYGGLFFGLILSVSGVYLNLHPATKAAPELQAVGNNLFFLGQFVLCAGYVGLFVKVHQKRWFTRAFSWLSPLGKMALTNYISHSIIFTTIFYGYAGGMFGQIDRTQQMLFVVVVIIFQVIVSLIWLSYFRFGPLEWLWRSATYLKLQPMKR
ncbi:DUF418 domain-containing protein [Thalassotalea sp. PP2-459]|uniref:DUF418 domain-containing protein n=1 Tax=Thalassotalea sp. PP2-459 TaxID=1742724 RepID=UPI0009F9C274|nr:DUF418 domain-containing protein [Thalassotalea sp. PP2-459]